MTDPKHSPSAGPTSGGSVLDPEWEAALRRGQEAEGEAGSVDAELALVHLLRHTREPEALVPEQLDAIWAQIGVELGASVEPAGAPWWRKAWIWWSAPALAAAAVLVVVVLDPGGESDNQADTVAQHSAPERFEAAKAGGDSLAQQGDAASAPSAAPEAAESAARGEAPAAGAGPGGARERASAGASGRSVSPFELSFAKLAPQGHLAIRVSVDQSRAELRSELLANARGGGR